MRWMSEPSRRQTRESMPKLKSHSGAAKRFRVTGSRLKHKHANKNHNFTNKRAKTKRQLRGTETVADQDAARVQRMLNRRVG